MNLNCTVDFTNALLALFIGSAVGILCYVLILFTRKLTKHFTNKLSEKKDEIIYTRLIEMEEEEVIGTEDESVFNRMNDQILQDAKLSKSSLDSQKKEAKNSFKRKIRKLKPMLKKWKVWASLGRLLTGFFTLCSTGIPLVFFILLMIKGAECKCVGNFNIDWKTCAETDCSPNFQTKYATKVNSYQWMNYENCNIGGSTSREIAEDCENDPYCVYEVYHSRCGDYCAIGGYYNVKSISLDVSSDLIEVSYGLVCPDSFVNEGGHTCPYGFAKYKNQYYCLNSKGDVAENIFISNQALNVSEIIGRMKLSYNDECKYTHKHTYQDTLNVVQPQNCHKLQITKGECDGEPNHCVFPIKTRYVKEGFVALDQEAIPCLIPGVGLLTDAIVPMNSTSFDEDGNFVYNGMKYPEDKKKELEAKDAVYQEDDTLDLIPTRWSKLLFYSILIALVIISVVILIWILKAIFC